MAEAFVQELKFKEGDMKVYVDREKKLIRDNWSGKLDAKELEQGVNLLKNEMMKFGRGEPLWLHEATNLDVKFWTNEQAKIAKEAFALAVALCKKCATVYASFVHRKSNEAATGVLPDNHRYFSSVPEAAKWLLS